MNVLRLLLIVRIWARSLIGVLERGGLIIKIILARIAGNLLRIIMMRHHAHIRVVRHHSYLLTLRHHSYRLNVRHP